MRRDGEDRTSSESDRAEGPSAPTRAIRAVRISELQDLIEAGNRTALRMRWVEFPFGVVLGVLFLRMAGAYDGPAFILLTIVFSLLLLRRMWMLRRRTEHLWRLKQELSELEEDSAGLRGPL